MRQAELMIGKIYTVMGEDGTRYVFKIGEPVMIDDTTPSGQRLLEKLSVMMIRGKPQFSIGWKDTGMATANTETAEEESPSPQKKVAKTRKPKRPAKAAPGQNELD